MRNIGQGGVEPFVLLGQSFFGIGARGPILISDDPAALAERRVGYADRSAVGEPAQMMARPTIRQSLTPNFIGFLDAAPAVMAKRCGGANDVARAGAHAHHAGGVADKLVDARIVALHAPIVVQK